MTGHMVTSTINAGLLHVALIVKCRRQRSDSPSLDQRALGQLSAVVVVENAQTKGSTITLGLTRTPILGVFPFLISEPTYTPLFEGIAPTVLRNNALYSRLVIPDMYSTKFTYL